MQDLPIAKPNNGLAAAAASPATTSNFQALWTGKVIDLNTLKNQKPDADVLHTCISQAHDHALALGVAGEFSITGYGQDPKTGVKLKSNTHIRHFKVGESKEMAETLLRWTVQPHRNAYASFNLYKPGLDNMHKGAEADIAPGGVLTIVADLDRQNAPTWPQMTQKLPSPHGVTETSPGRFQLLWNYSRGIDVAFGKKIAKLLMKYLNTAFKNPDGKPTCDSATQDMSHMWRPPGTLNHPNQKKVIAGRSADPQLAVPIKSPAGETIDPDEFYALLLELTKAMPDSPFEAFEDPELEIKTKDEIDKLIYDPNADPDPKLWAILWENHSAEFGPKWRSELNKFKPKKEGEGDETPLEDAASEIQMTTANFLAECNWPAQEIANALIKQRRLLRQTRNWQLKHRVYYQITVGKAIKWARAIKLAEGAQEVKDSEEAGITVPADKKAILARAKLKEYLGLDVIEMVKHGLWKPYYIIKLVGGGSIRLKSIDHLNKPKEFEKAAIVALDKVVFWPANKWKTCVANFLDLQRIVRQDLDSIPGLMSFYLKGFIFDYHVGIDDVVRKYKEIDGKRYRGMTDAAMVELAIHNYKKVAIKTDGHWHVGISPFFEYCKRIQGWKNSTHELLAMLTDDECGCKSIKFNCRREDGARTTVRLYRIPHELVPDEDVAEFEDFSNDLQITDPKLARAAFYEDGPWPHDGVADSTR